jgi:hypothetical protein
MTTRIFCLVRSGHGLNARATGQALPTSLTGSQGFRPSAGSSCAVGLSF